MTVKVVSAVICDEVRQEMDGHAIIVGARQSGPALPIGEDVTVDRIAIYVELETSYPPPAKFVVRLNDPEADKTIFENSFDNEFEPIEDVPEGADLRGIMLLVVNRTDVKVPGAGVYKVQLQTEEADWVDVRNFSFPASDRSVSK